MTDSSKKQLTPDDLIPGGSGYKRLLPTTMEEISLSPDGTTARYKFSEVYQEVSLSDGSTFWQFGVDTLNGIIFNAGKMELQKSLPTLHFLERNRAEAWMKLKQEIWFVNCQTAQLLHRIQLLPEWENLLFNEEKKLFSFTCRGDLSLLHLSGETTLVMKQPSPDVLAGGIPSRYEFGIEEGAFWSPKGNKLAYYIVDQTAVTSYPLVKIQEPIATLDAIKYPMAGAPSETVRMSIFDLESQKNIELESSDWQESYLTCVTWSSDEKAIFVAEVDRRQKHCRVMSFDASTGRRIASLWEEEEEKYVEPQHPLLFIDENRFVWQSRRDGFNHLYLYDISGKLLRQLTRGNFEVTQLYGYCPKSDELLFLCTQSSPLNRDACAVSITDGNIRRLVNDEGAHTLFIAWESGDFIDSFSSINTPNRITLHNLFNDETEVLYSAENPYEGYDFAIETEIGSYEKEGDEIFYRIVRPANIEKGKRYPLAYYVYGGPHVQLIRNEWMAGTKGFEYMMALNGYVVMSIDPHGSDNRGKAFEQKIWRNIGAQQMEDYRYSIEWLLREKEYIDEKRMGIYGWSFGGFMATRLMLRCPNLFAFGVAGGAVIDWAFYEVMYTERYMETPALNPEGFKENNLCHYIDDLKGDLLLIHCDNDPVVLWQNTLTFLKKATEADKQVDYAVYPGHQHNVQGKERVHLMKRILRYFNMH